MTPPAQPKNAQPALMDRQLLLRIAESQPPNRCSHVAPIQNVKRQGDGRRTVCGCVDGRRQGQARVEFFVGLGAEKLEAVQCHWSRMLGVASTVYVSTMLVQVIAL
jgi:hypothetical protein